MIGWSRDMTVAIVEALKGARKLFAFLAGLGFLLVLAVMVAKSWLSEDALGILVDGGVYMLIGYGGSNVGARLAERRSAPKGGAG